MSNLKFNIIVAACKNRGIGYNNRIPWNLPKELKYFSAKTQFKIDENKQNVIIMGRKTYFGIPKTKRPLKDRINIVLTSKPDQYEFPKTVLTFTSLVKVFNYLEEEDPQVRDTIENLWIIGGAVLYSEALLSKRCHQIYYTEIFCHFECDTFFPNIPPNDFEEINSNTRLHQEENGVTYRYKIYEKKK